MKSHILENLNSNFKEKIFLSNKIKEYYNNIDSILVPTDTMSIRLNTGLPIFINYKHHPFRHDEIIDWNIRLNLANDFYNAENFSIQKQVLDKILKLESVSHVIFKKSQTHPKCENLIDDKNYILLDLSSCYKN